MIKRANGYGLQMFKNGIDASKAKNTMIHVAKNEYNTDPSEDGVFYGKSGIKIKPSRRGSFTSYCGGEVT
jgi:hypothetical protein